MESARAGTSNEQAAVLLDRQIESLKTAIQKWNKEQVHDIEVFFEGSMYKGDLSPDISIVNQGVHLRNMCVSEAERREKNYMYNELSTLTKQEKHKAFLSTSGLRYFALSLTSIIIESMYLEWKLV